MEKQRKGMNTLALHSNCCAEKGNKPNAAAKSARQMSANNVAGFVTDSRVPEA